ncbi:MAG: LuxR C-terminal-related transcriptional regulator [Rhodoglobus sp.]
MGQTADLVEIVSRGVQLDSAGARALAAELLARPDLDVAFHARVLAVLAQIEYVDANYAEAVVLAEQAVAIARIDGGAEALIYALGARLFASAGTPWAGSVDIADYYEAAWGMRHELENLEPESRMLAGHLLVEGVFSIGRMSEAGELLESLAGLPELRTSENRTLHPYLPFMQLQTARVLFFQGRVNEALPVVEAVLVHANQIGDPLWAMLSRCYLGLIAAHRGDRDAAISIIENVVDAFPDPRGYLGGAVYTLAAYAMLVAGEMERATELAVSGGGGPDLPYSQVADKALTYDLLVTAALSRGDLAEAEEWGIRSLPLAAHPAAGGLVEQALARIDLARGDAGPSAERAEVSAARARLTGRYLDAARSEIFRARALAAAGLRDAAVSGLSALARDGERDGLYVFMRAAIDELRKLGEPVVATPGSGWGMLSERERQIAVLVSAGYSNRVIGESIFLSERTVQSAVSRILSTLGVASRSALPGQVATYRLGEPQDDLPPLTARQREVAELVAAGSSNRAIGEQLGISVKTVEKHIGEILQRWSVSSRTGIASIVATTPESR